MKNKRNVTELDKFLYQDFISQTRIFSCLNFFFQKHFKNRNKIEKIRMDSEKSINSFKIKQDRLPAYLLNNYFFCQFVNNFQTLLLCKINVLDFFDMSDFFQIFGIG